MIKINLSPTSILFYVEDYIDISLEKLDSGSIIKSSVAKLIRFFWPHTRRKTRHSYVQKEDVLKGLVAGAMFLRIYPTVVQFDLSHAKIVHSFNNVLLFTLTVYRSGLS